MLQDLQEGAINAVVVYDQDRLVRQPKELEELLGVCDRAHAWHIAAVSGEIDVRNSNDLFRALSWPPSTPKNSTAFSGESAASNWSWLSGAGPTAALGATATAATSAPSSPMKQLSSRIWPAELSPVSPSPCFAENSTPAVFRRRPVAAEPRDLATHPDRAGETRSLGAGEEPCPTSRQQKEAAAMG